MVVVPGGGAGVGDYDAVDCAAAAQREGSADKETGGGTRGRTGGGTDGQPTGPLMTHFEQSGVLSVRAQQISEGGPTMVDVNPTDTPEQKAWTELVARKTPMRIVRKVGGVKKTWRVCDLRPRLNMREHPGLESFWFSNSRSNT